MDEEDNSLDGGATYLGCQEDSLSDLSLGDEGTLGDKLVDQETVIDDGEVFELESRYRIESTLGRGGMGEVLLAVNTRLDRKVAIKRILGEAARSTTAVDRFLTEAKSIAAINHLNVVQIYDYGRTKDGFTFPILADIEKNNWQAWGNSMWPSVYVLDKQGYIREFWPGELRWEGATGDKYLQQQIEKLMKE